MTWRKTLPTMALVLAAVVLAWAHPNRAVAATVHKCVTNGAVTYQQDPCPSTQARKDPSLAELNAAEKRRRAATASPPAPELVAPAAQAPTAYSRGFVCDGRTHCSQMTSCAEAKYFLANCPGVQMDGDRNGLPCEKQWCTR